MANDEERLRLSNQLCFALYSATHAMTRTYRPLLEALDLTYPQYLVLLSLWEDDGRTVKALGEHLHLDSGTLTPLLKRMETRGLLRRARDPEDERSVRAHLTDEGAALREKAKAIPLEIGKAIGWPLDRIVALRGELHALRDALRAVDEQD